MKFERKFSVLYLVYSTVKITDRENCVNHGSYLRLIDRPGGTSIDAAGALRHDQLCPLLRRIGLHVSFRDQNEKMAYFAMVSGARNVETRDKNAFGVMF
jgi:hypothetical protein